MPGRDGAARAIRPGDELRTLNATPMDIADGKRAGEMRPARAATAPTASAPIRACPTLPVSGRLISIIELKAYQSGARGDSAMNNAVKFLSDDALIKVAAYFASLDPAPAPAAAAGPAKLDPVQAGKTVAAAACAGCHGDAGVSQIPGIPSLVGLDPKYLVDAMKAYKNGQRKNDTMKAMLASVSEAAMNNIALFYALQKPARAKTPAAGDQAAGKAAAASCGGCHGEDGVSGKSGDAEPGRTGRPIPRGGAAGL